MTNIQPMNGKILIEMFERTIGNIVIVGNETPSTIKLARVLKVADDVEDIVEGDIVYLRAQPYQTIMDSVGKSYVVAIKGDVVAKEVK